MDNSGKKRMNSRKLNPQAKFIDVEYGKAADILPFTAAGFLFTKVFVVRRASILKVICLSVLKVNIGIFLYALVSTCRSLFHISYGID